MRNDGSQLEQIVAFIEKQLVHSGVAVEVNQRTRTRKGTVAAEFDVLVSGKIGSTNFRWLIECRDRKRAAPSSWVQQLIGRRIAFRFDRVTAVSTGGFSAAAQMLARDHGIELREITEVSAEQFSDWLVLHAFQFDSRTSCLTSARLEPVSIADDLKEKLCGLLCSAARSDRILRTSKGDLHTLDEAFLGTIGTIGSLFDDMIPNGPERQVRLDTSFTNDDDCFYVDVDETAVRISRIVFEGNLRLTRKWGEIVRVKEYRTVDSDEPISQSATFQVSDENSVIAIEFQRIPASGRTSLGIKISRP